MCRLMLRKVLPPWCQKRQKIDQQEVDPPAADNNLLKYLLHLVIGVSCKSYETSIKICEVDSQRGEAE
jgi:hypothetical protein